MNQKSIRPAKFIVPGNSNTPAPNRVSGYTVLSRKDGSLLVSELLSLVPGGEIK